MSDPMSNMEIEDVLSSIRRLVSESTERSGPGMGGAAGKSAGRPSEKPLDALVLTPSLRVEVQEAEKQPSDADPGEPEGAWLDKAGEAPQAGLDESSTSSRYEGLEAAFDKVEEEFEPDGSEFGASGDEILDWGYEEGEEVLIDLSTSDLPASNVLFMRSKNTGGGHEVGPAAPVSASEDWLPPEEELSEEASLAEDWPEPEEDWTAPDLPRPKEQAVVEEVETLMDAAGEVGHTADETVETAPQSFVFRSAERAGSVEDAEVLPDWTPDADTATEVHAADLADHEADEAPREAIHRLHFTEVADDGGGRWDESEPTFGAEDGIDEVALSAALADHSPTGDLAPVIDEERLAEIVAAVVRAELRGALGDRITHNVRKLVRREVQRALETRDIR